MSAFQGFDIKLNLSETNDGRDILNNLAGAPIADDIILFRNNLRNTSELLVGVAQRQGFVIRLDPKVQRFVFTNGTKISVFAGNTKVGDYFVGESNNVNEFRIYEDEALTQAVFPPAGTDVKYVRSDAISFSDIANLSTPREPVIENISESQINSGVDESNERGNIYTSFIKVYSTIRTGFNSVLSDYINDIETELDVFSQKKETSLSNLKDFSSTNPITLSGSLFISDPAGTNSINVSTTSGPGVFILNPETDQGTRAFSSNENVWSEVGSDLVVGSKEAVVGNFVFENGVRILRKNGSPAITTETDLARSFTHFVKVSVSGEEYSLCLK